MKKIIIGIILFFPILSFGQNSSLYESKVLKTDKLNVEYMDFGGQGLPLIVIQGAHNYFDESSNNPYINYENKSWINLYSTFTDDYHVIAPLKRGFGKTDKQLKVESVKTSNQDLISFMDTMEIEKAYFIGRDISAQNMLDLAENYPNRVLGLIFIDPRFVFTDVKDNEAEEFVFYSFAESYSSSEYENYQMKETELYRPEIYTDSTKKINVPSLLFYHSAFSPTTLEFRRIEKFIQRVAKEKNIDWNKEYSSKKIAVYFEELSKDKERMVSIRDYLQDNNPTPKMYEVLIDSLGDNLIIFNETNMQTDNVEDALMKVYAPVIRAFLFMLN